MRVGQVRTVDVDVVAESGLLRAVVEPSEAGEWSNPRRSDENFGVMWAKHSRYTLGDDRYSSPNAHNVAVHRRENPAWCELDDWLRLHRPTTAEMVDYLTGVHGATVVLPLYLLDHSGLSISAGENLVGDVAVTRDAEDRSGRFAGDGQGWDTSYVGFLFDTAAARARWEIDPGRVEEILRREVAAYDAYLTGDVWDVRVEARPADHDWHPYRDGSLRCVDCATSAEFAADPCEAWGMVDSVSGALGRDRAEDLARELLAEAVAEPVQEQVQGDVAEPSRPGELIPA